MEPYIKKSDIVAELERRRNYYENIQMIKPVYESNIEDFSEVLSFINTLEVKEVEVPVSKDLEEAANTYIGHAPEVDEDSSIYGKRQAFKAGAEWQKNKIMENAIKCEITWMDGFILNYTQKQQDDLLEKIGAKIGDKVKLVIIKED